MKTRIALFLVLLPTLSGVGAAPAGGKVPPDAPVKISVAVAPQAISAGTDAVLTVKLAPKTGIKLNKYPKIKLQIPQIPGLVDAAEQSMGNPAPPPADQLDANYFSGSIDPLTLTLHLDAQAAKGRHDIIAKLSYFYCVAASGFCAPAKTELKIPVTVR